MQFDAPATWAPFPRLTRRRRPPPHLPAITHSTRFAISQRTGASPSLRPALRRSTASSLPRLCCASIRFDATNGSVTSRSLRSHQRNIATNHNRFYKLHE